MLFLRGKGDGFIFYSASTIDFSVLRFYIDMDCLNPVYIIDRESDLRKIMGIFLHSLQDNLRLDLCVQQNHLNG